MADAILRIKVIELQCVLFGCRKLLAGIFTNIMADMDMKVRKCFRLLLCRRCYSEVRVKRLMRSFTMRI